MPAPPLFVSHFGPDSPQGWKEKQNNGKVGCCPCPRPIFRGGCLFSRRHAEGSDAPVRSIFAMLGYASEQRHRSQEAGFDSCRRRSLPCPAQAGRPRRDRGQEEGQAAGTRSGARHDHRHEGRKPLPAASGSPAPPLHPTREFLVFPGLGSDEEEQLTTTAPNHNGRLQRR